MEVNETDVHFKLRRSKEPVPTAELDFHSLVGDEVYGAIVKKAVQKLAEKNKGITATIYTHECNSVSFMEQTWSVFFAVCGNHKTEIVEAIGRAFRAAGARERSPSDFAPMDAYPWVDLCHIEDGVVWSRLDAVTWTDQIF